MLQQETFHIFQVFFQVVTKRIYMHSRDLSCCSRENCYAKKKWEVAHMFRNCHAIASQIAMLHKVVVVHASAAFRAQAHLLLPMNSKL